VRAARIVVAGAGFAGVWAAMGAARLLHGRGAESGIGITLVDPGDALVIRPRLYESDLRGVRVPLDRLLAPVGVAHRRAAVEGIDVESRTLTLAGRSPGALAYDQLVLCTGSGVSLPDGAAGVHRVDSYDQAAALQEAVVALGEDPDARFDATVVGAGFTGLEVATELAGRLRAAAEAAGRPAEASVCLVEQAATAAPEFGPRARTAIEQALHSLGVRIRTGMPVTQVGAGGARLANGERLESDLVVWTAGPRAGALNEQLGLALDARGRLPVDSHLATGAEGVWAAGDCAVAMVDGRHPAPMSCQHAIPQGRQAGENAAAALLGRPLSRYAQPLYLTCLDLGPAGALLTCGFDRDAIVARGERAKRFKRFINRSLIYPPASGDASELLGLGRRATPGRTGAMMQRMALRSSVVRSIVTARGEDRAELWRPP
jgi:NADH dehydrogenase